MLNTPDVMISLTLAVDAGEGNLSIDKQVALWASDILWLSDTPGGTVIYLTERLSRSLKENISVLENITTILSKINAASKSTTIKSL